MLTSDQKELRVTQRKQFRDYLAGDRNAPFVLERSDAYGIDEVICHSLGAQALRTVRYIIMQVARFAPSCFLKSILYRSVGVKVGKHVCFTPGVLLDPIFPQLITLDDGCCLGMGCRLFTHEYTATHFRLGRIHIARGAVIGACTMVRNDVRVGEKATAGAHSFVNNDVTDGDIVGGVPARPLKRKRTWN